MNTLDVGYVYLLVNPEIPGYVKIGKTHREPTKRAKELSSSGVPGYWKVHYQKLVPQCDVVERDVHRSLSQNRPIKRRELFKIEPEIGVRAIERFSESNIALLPLWPNLSELDKAVPNDVVTERRTAQLLEKESIRHGIERDKEAAAIRMQEEHRESVDSETTRILKSGPIGLGPFLWIAFFAVQYREGKAAFLFGVTALFLVMGFVSNALKKKAAKKKRNEAGLPELCD